MCCIIADDNLSDLQVFHRQLFLTQLLGILYIVSDSNAVTIFFGRRQG